MRTVHFGRMLAVAAAGTFVFGAGAEAASCRNTGDFGAWMRDFRAEAAAAGVSRKTIAAALDGVAFDQGVIDRDRKQSVFSQSFLEFSDRMIAKYRIDQGGAQIKKHAAVFARIEKEFGVPAPVIVAFWGLESDFGANMGKLATLRSLATLAYDCRRPEKFRPELIAALKVVDRGDLKPAEMIGAWAGELGQTQFLPRHYVDHAVDYDGDGRRNLLRSAPDVLGSTAAYLKHIGWQQGEPWLEEVRVPAEMDWVDADVTIEKPRAHWAKAGVRRASGKALPADAVPTMLILPMGRLGPAFLAYRNFKVYLEWNNSLVYSTTAAYFATRLAGLPVASRGTGQIAPFGFKEIRELQALLVKRGHDVGEVDGKLGAATRSAVRKVQIELGLPADSYPTPELVARLRR